MLIITREIASNLISVCVVYLGKGSSLRAVKVWKYSSSLVHKSQQDAQVTEFIFVRELHYMFRVSLSPIFRGTKQL
jgi:hypothetical protein